ncbi:nucleoside phosphorylase domain-containing protein [Aspergillus candidus]|uniref:Nucleoside phosphorylase domain-containing protein n=1 Tax=Aspergillus candidus TaxID=41067 RepID=A0A2I2FA61_ASPCN|nr:nucleoside phosphorylase domain-containing protein [Aspergillus candidus]PLB37505.1 nucleoside phosphorylase domain-containing protein [Aspergillus candidus]
MVIASLPRSLGDFSVAIVCASAEASPIRALFDEIYHHEGEASFRVSDDPHDYTVGRMGRHQTVLAYLPGRGKVSASRLACRLKITYPDLRIILVVGTCGAVPRAPDGRDIFLGDVLMSTALIEYDQVRRWPNFVERRMRPWEVLPRPAPELSSYLNKLQATRGRQRVEAQMGDHMSQLQRAMGHAVAGYPGSEADRLYPSNVPTVTAACVSPVPVRQRSADTVSPSLHLGQVGTGEGKVASAHSRDQLCERDGIIGFESEAIAFWYDMPCVVIKGVADYADGRENEVWTQYAAATAASAAKAFLAQYCPPERNTEPIKLNFSVPPVPSAPCCFSMEAK